MTLHDPTLSNGITARQTDCLEQVQWFLEAGIHPVTAMDALGFHVRRADWNLVFTALLIRWDFMHSGVAG